METNKPENQIDEFIHRIMKANHKLFLSYENMTEAKYTKVKECATALENATNAIEAVVEAIELEKHK